MALTREGGICFAGTTVNPPSPEELMLEYVGGNPKAFDPLYRLLAPQAYAYLLRLTRSQSQAEDLLQTTFIKVHRARSAYIVGAPVMPWVIAIARRSFLDERRSAQSRKETLSPDGTLPEPRPSAALEETDASEAMDQALDELPESYREAIQLTKIVGLTLEEAADILETTTTAVKLRVHRGYVLLRERLAHLERRSP